MSRYFYNIYAYISVATQYIVLAGVAILVDCIIYNKKIALLPLG